MKLAASTINFYLNGLRNWCIGLGFPNLLRTEYGGPLLCLDRVPKGIKKLHKGHSRPRLPITIDILRMTVSFLSFGCFGIFEDLMMSAAVTFAFYGFLQCGEFTVASQAAFSPHQSLCMQDTVFYPTMDSPDYMTVRFKFSKTDPFGKGHIVTIHTTHTLTCPVRAMSQYLRAQQYQPDVPIFVLADGTILTRSKFINRTHVLLTIVALRQSSMLVIASALELLPQLLLLVCLTG